MEISQLFFLLYMPLPTYLPGVSLTGWVPKKVISGLSLYGRWGPVCMLGIHNAGEMISATGAVASTIAITSVYYFIAARIVLGIGEAGNFPAAIKVTAEYFPKKDRAYSTSILMPELLSEL